MPPAPSCPKISFGIIVLNGEPFTKHCLRSVYPFAYEIIVVEGATPGARKTATVDGHSNDGTLQSIVEFKNEEDGENKLRVITKDGFWSEKDEMSKAYAAEATGDYLWQVDIDEFYMPEDMALVINMLRDDPSITAVSFKQIQFWGGFPYFVDGWYLRMGAEQFHRIFRWGKNYTYSTHRPPTVLTPNGQDTRDIKWVNSSQMNQRGIFLYHYSLVFPKQVRDKCLYYKNAEWSQRQKATEWAEKVFLELRRPYRVHNVYDYPGWLERFNGSHPPEVEALRSDIDSGRLNLEIRPTEDIEQLLRSRYYSLGRKLLRISSPMAKAFRRWLFVKGALKRLVGDPIGTCRLLVHRAQEIVRSR